MDDLAKKIEKLDREVSENSRKIEILLRAILINKQLLKKEEENEHYLKDFLKHHNNPSPPQFRQIISSLRYKKEIPENLKEETYFLFDVVFSLSKIANRKGKYPFKVLVRVLWNRLREKWGGNFSRSDCETALSNLLKFTNLLIPCYQDIRPFKYYLFNPSSEFYNHLSSLRARIRN